MRRAREPLRREHAPRVVAAPAADAVRLGGKVPQGREHALGQLGGEGGGVPVLVPPVLGAWSLLLGAPLLVGSMERVRYALKTSPASGPAGRGDGPTIGFAGPATT